MMGRGLRARVLGVCGQEVGFPPWPAGSAVGLPPQVRFSVAPSQSGQLVLRMPSYLSLLEALAAQDIPAQVRRWRSPERGGAS